MRTLVLVHGLPDHSGSWEKIFPLMTPSFNQFHIIGLPGIGDGELLSENTTLPNLAEKLKERIYPKNVTFIGHDFGGVLGILISKMFPDIISNLVLINSPDPKILKISIKNDPDQKNRSRYISKIISSPIETFSANDYAFLKAYLFKKDNYLSSSYKASLQSLWRNKNTLKNIESYYQAFLNYEGNVMDIKSRTLQIWSKKDPFIGEVVQKKMSSYNKDHKVASLDTDSHWPHLSLPEVVYRKIENFIGE